MGCSSLPWQCWAHPSTQQHLLPKGQARRRQSASLVGPRIQSYCLEAGSGAGNRVQLGKCTGDRLGSSEPSFAHGPADARPGGRNTLDGQGGSQGKQESRVAAIHDEQPWHGSRLQQRAHLRRPNCRHATVKTTERTARLQRAAAPRTQPPSRSGHSGQTQRSVCPMRAAAARAPDRAAKCNKGSPDRHPA